MKKLISIASVLLLVVIFVSCNQKKQAPQNIAKEIEIEGSRDYNSIGKTATQTLTAALLKQLSKQIKDNGVVAAINYCNLNAIPITDSISDVLGVKISRISHKNRNPKNVPSSEDLRYIDKFQSDTLLSTYKIKGNVLSSQIVAYRLNDATYYEPILIGMPTCLKCHGNPETDIAPEVLAVINEKYPDDKATGFKMGELRGLFKVEFDR